MSKAKLLTGVILICVLLSGLPAFAQPSISGPQSGTLGPGTYIVVGDIRVMTGNTLTIVAGTEFLHNGHHTWEISGTLNIQGAEGDSVVFKRQTPNETCKWGGIRFQSGAPAGTIDYAIIEYCSNGTTPYYTYGGGIFSNGVDLNITNSRISNCSAYWDGGGMYCNNGAQIIVDHCMITDNQAISGANGGGIYFSGCSNCEITNSIIARNGATGT